MFGDDRTEQPTAKRLSEASQKGEIARSAEVQTVLVLYAAIGALTWTAGATWDRLEEMFAWTLGHLGSVDLPNEDFPKRLAQGFAFVGACAGPIAGAALVAGLTAGVLQSRFNLSFEALEANLERLNPIAGLSRVFSVKSLLPTGFAFLRLFLIVVLAYSGVRNVLNDPIFYSTVDVARIAQFLAASSGQILIRIAGAMAALAGADYAYQWWKHHRGLMMTKQEVKDEFKNSEGNPEVKARQKQARMRPSLKRMLAEVPKADVVVTNPTRIAIALRYDRKKMRAPRVVAKGIRLNAQRIREMAARHGVPIQENKPLARLLFKHAKVGGEVPAELYVAVAEVLAWVYRMNRYRYYRQMTMEGAATPVAQPAVASSVGASKT